MKRTVKDCIWLRDILEKIHPGVFVPPSPQFSLINKNDEEIFKHKKFLINFFQSISLNPLLKTSWHLQHFLKETDLFRFKSMKKQSETIKKPKSANKIQNSEGFIKCDPKFNKELINSLKSYIALSSPILKKIKDLHRKLEEKFKKSTKIMNEISSKLKDYIQTIGMIPNNSKNSNYLEIYQKIIDSLNRNIMEHAKIIKDTTRGYFKYSISELSSLEKLIEEVTTQDKTQLEAVKKFYQKLSETYSKKSRENWDLAPGTDKSLLDNKDYALGQILHHERTKVIDTINMSCYYNYQLSNQFDWYLQFNQTKNFLFFKQYAENEISTTERLLESLSNYLKNIQSHQSICI